MTTEQAIELLKMYVNGRSSLTKVQAAEALDVVVEAMAVMGQRFADRELVRLGHITREGMTPAQYHIAEAKARAAHPEAWSGALGVSLDEMRKWAS